MREILYARCSGITLNERLHWFVRHVRSLHTVNINRLLDLLIQHNYWLFLLGAQASTVLANLCEMAVIFKTFSVFLIFLAQVAFLGMVGYSGSVLDLPRDTFPRSLMLCINSLFRGSERYDQICDRLQLRGRNLRIRVYFL